MPQPTHSPSPGPSEPDDPPRPHGPRPPPWPRPVRIAVALVALLAGTLVWGLVGPEPAIVVGPRTTFVTAPLAADGLPDYEAAALAMSGPAPAATDNGAVDLLQVLWPLGIEAADLPAVCAALGIAATPPAHTLPDPGTSAVVGAEFKEMFDIATDRPWTSAELPAVEAWLLEHAALLDRLVAAAERPRLWLPEAAFVDGRPARLSSTLVESRWMWKLYRLLVGRANWHLGAGRHEAAWRDIRAGVVLGQRYAATVHGMSRSIADLQAFAMYGGATQWATRHLLGSPATPAAVIATIRKDLDAIGPPPGPEAGLEADRRMAIDSLVWIARREPGGRSARAAELAKSDIGLFDRQIVLDADPWARTALWTSLDWNLVLERVNDLHDRCAAAARLPAPAERLAALRAVDAEVAGGPAAAPATALSRFLTAIPWACNRGWRSGRVGDAVARIFGTGCAEPYVAAVAEQHALFAMTRTAAALAAWRLDQPAGSPPYPERLEDLVPALLDRVPLDPFRAAPLVYERRGDGYLLFSVGRDGVSDGGSDAYGWIVGGEWQAAPADTPADVTDILSGRGPPRRFDLVIRMPCREEPPPPPTPRSSPP